MEVKLVLEVVEVVAVEVRLVLKVVVGLVVETVKLVLDVLMEVGGPQAEASSVCVWPLTAPDCPDQCASD